MKGMRKTPSQLITPATTTIITTIRTLATITIITATGTIPSSGIK